MSFQSNAPWDEYQVRSINQFQQLSDVLSRMICECGGLFFAKAEGLVCRRCFNSVEQVPVFVSNGSWNRIRVRAKEETAVRRRKKKE